MNCIAYEHCHTAKQVAHSPSIHVLWTE